jgi:Asp-tRNA(Asn)/Glu-tRNA(Gln) amidotransferase C subunit
MSSGARSLVRAVQHGTDWTKHVARQPLQHLGSTEAIDNLLAEPTWSVRSLLPPKPARLLQPQRKKRPRPRYLSDMLHSLTDNEQTQPSSVPSNSRSSNTSEDQPSTQSDENEITSTKLHHLLKLSALPLPATPEEEARLLSDLRSQIHFVRELQSVDTKDVEPLVAIRDETHEAMEENQINLSDMQPFLEQEEKVGNNGTVRRKKTDLVAWAKEQQENKRLDEIERAEEEKDGVFRWDKLPPSGNEAGRRWGKYYVVKRGKRTSTTSAAD